MVFPWGAMHHCFAHGHEHDETHIPCSVRAQEKGLAVWPPMDCFEIEQSFFDYDQQVFHLPGKDTAAENLVYFLVNIVIPHQDLLSTVTCKPPERLTILSDPFFNNHSLRGPPLV